MAESRPHTLLKKGAEADIYRADGTVLKSARPEKLPHKAA